MKEVEKIKAKQLEIHRKFVREGWYYKLVLLLCMYPAGYFLYYYIGGHNNGLKPSERLTDNGILVLTIFLALLFAGLVMTIRPVRFINTIRVTRINRIFKIELFNLIREKLPELDFNHPIQKLHPKLFHGSGLFELNYQDYIGDDFMSGEYLGKRFDLGELHVFRLFKNIFRGIFWVSYLKKDIPDWNEKMTEICQSAEYEVLTGQYGLKVHMLFNRQKFYLAIEKKELLFENHDKQHIEKLGKDLALLEATIALGKKAIEVLEG